eukprot:scaffold654_cov207-Ochromonas_danica.AAC.5
MITEKVILKSSSSLSLSDHHHPPGGPAPPAKGGGSSGSGRGEDRPPGGRSGEGEGEGGQPILSLIQKYCESDLKTFCFNTTTTTTTTTTKLFELYHCLNQQATEHLSLTCQHYLSSSTPPTPGACNTEAMTLCPDQQDVIEITVYISIKNS